MFKSKYIKLTIGCVMIALGIMLMLNNVCNTHIHVLENGNIVKHAHPFDKDSSNDHEHSKCLYFLLNSLLLFIPEVKEYIFYTKNIKREYSNVDEYLCYTIILLPYSLRAPPHVA